LADANFSSYPGPEWYQPQSVSRAIAAAWEARDESSATAACDNILYAIGNLHAGTYYPVAPVAVSAMAPLLTSESRWPRLAALEVLSDLCGSFLPEPGFESTTLADGSPCSTAGALRDVIGEFAPLLRMFLNSPAADAMEVELATHILDALNDA
jgi:hypothetical protein